MKSLLLLFCLLTAAGFAAAPVNAPKGKTTLRRFNIKEVKGKVLAWTPWSSSWSQLEAPSEVWESSLIQVTNGSTVTFEMRSADGFIGLASDRVEVTLNHAAVFRLDDKILRKVELNTFFIPQMPDITQAKGEKKGMMYETFHEAWERFAALVAPGKMEAKASWLRDLAKDEKDQDATVAAKSKKLKLFAPTDNQMLVADKLPMEFTVLWQPAPEPNLEYEVMMWRIDEARRPPIAITRFDYYYAKQFRDGDFYIQVASKDGRYQSPVRTVHVMLPMQGTITHTTNTKMGTEPLPLALPPEGFHYVTHVFPAEFTFSWEHGLLASGTAYQFVLRDGAGKELVRRLTNERTLRLKINKPGDYKWQIEGIPQATDRRGNTSPKIYSEVRNFNLENAADLVAQPLTSLIDQLVATGKSTVIYSEDGI